MSIQYAGRLWGSRVQSSSLNVIPEGDHGGRNAGDSTDGEKNSDSTRPMPEVFMKR